jgi:hypothetical protein
MTMNTFARIGTESSILANLSGINSVSSGHCRTIEVPPPKCIQQTISEMWKGATSPRGAVHHQNGISVSVYSYKR